MELIVSGNTGIKDTDYAVTCRIIDPALQDRIDLLIGKLHGTIQNDGHFRRTL